eukprot:PLAT1102.1.p1 GENE.PLAT1102.1~~PLAT1102.1.p1  ORF type:complete len:293 (+),score=125.61 PLAT1102.1:68-946(+)
MLRTVSAALRAPSSQLTALRSLASTAREGSLVLTTADVDDSGKESGVWTLQFNDPAKLNMLNEAVGDEMGEAVQHLKDVGARAVVLTGSGRAFSAGGDLAFLDERTRTPALENAKIMRDFYSRFLVIRSLHCPVIAAINGPAIGAGMCLAMATDVRIAARDAKMGFTFATLGIHPGMAATHFLPRAVGTENAMRLLLTGDVVSGDEALQLGLVSSLTDDGDSAKQEALTLARRMAAASPVAVQSCVRSLRTWTDVGLEEALWREADSQAHCYAADDLLEGLAAVREKRKPSF